MYAGEIKLPCQKPKLISDNSCAYYCKLLSVADKMTHKIALPQSI